MLTSAHLLAYIAVMAGVTYLIRLLPLVCFRKNYQCFCAIIFVLCAVCRAGRNDGTGDFLFHQLYVVGCGWLDCRRVFRI